MIRAARKSRGHNSTPRFIAVRAMAWAVGVAVLSVAASGCTSGTTSMLANMPESVGGLPKDVPVRPDDGKAFPAVHDMPPPRPNSTLTPEQVKSVEAEISFARDRQKKQAGAPIPDDPPAPAKGSGTAQ
jgi:hypothetical protein